MATRLGSWVVEEISPPKLSFNRDGSITGRREFKASWTDAQQIAIWLLPHSITPNSGGVIIVGGQSWPGLPQLLVTTVDVEAFDANNPGLDDDATVATCPSGATLTVAYETLSTEEGHTEEGGDGSVSLNLQTQCEGEYVRLGTRFRWGGKDGLTDGGWNQDGDVEAHIRIPQLQFSVTLDRLPVLPLHMWKSTIGKVNSLPMSLFDNAPAESVLFSGANAHRTLTVPNDRGGIDSLWEVELRFDQRLIFDGDDTWGWNHIYHPQAAGWEKPILANGQTIYLTTDLNELLTPTVPPQPVEE